MRLSAALIVVFQCLAGLAAADAPRVVAYEIVDGRTIPEPLSSEIADAELGRRLYADPAAGDCASCHGVPGAAAGAAPDLGDVAARLEPGEMRLWIVAPQVIRPGTAMPAYYAAGQRTDPTDPRFGEPRLSAREIENILAYLARVAPPQ